MKIRHIAPINFNIPNGRSGPAILFYDLNEALFKKGVDIYPFVTKNSEVSGTKGYLYNVELNNYEPFNSINRMMRGRFIYSHVAKSLDGYENYDIIHSHLFDWTIQMSKLIKDKPLVITLHNYPNKELIQQFDNPNIHFVAVSDVQANQLSDSIMNLHTIHNGIDLERIPFSSKKKDFYLFVGRLVENKGVDVALKACIEKGKKIVVVGKPVETNEESKKYFLEKVEPLLKNELVTHIAEMNHGELLSYYKDAKALIFPLKDPTAESFGLVTVEALAAGTPVLAFDNELMRELLDEKCSILVKDYAEMCDKLDAVTELDPNYCRSVASSKYSREVMAENYIELYKKLVN